MNDKHENITLEKNDADHNMFFRIIVIQIHMDVS